MDEIKLKLSKLKLEFNSSVRDWILQQKTPARFSGRDIKILECHKWMNAPTHGYSKKFLWINGALGTGKSALVTQIVQNIRQNDIGSVDVFFCEASTYETQSASAVIRFIADFLNRISRSYFDEKLVNYICSHAFDSATNVDLFTRLIFEPTRRIESKEKIFILIDALDEMLPNECNSFIDLLRKFEVPKWLNFILTSRDESQMLLALSGVSEVISLNNETENLKDIAEYFRQELSLSEHDIIALATKCAGNFLYAFHICQFLQEYSDSTINDLPPSLFDMYDRMLDRKYENNDEFEKDAKAVFELLVAVKAPIAINDIANILGVSLSEINRRLKKISAFLIYYNAESHSSKEYRIYNLSFVEYLTTFQDNIYCINKQNGERAICAYLKHNPNELLKSKYYNEYGLLHAIENKDVGLISKLISSENEQLSEKIENDLFFVYLTNKTNVIDVLSSLDGAVRILLTTYRKGLSFGYNIGDIDNMQDIITLLKAKQANIRAIMLEGERLQRKKLWDDAEEKFSECLHLAIKDDKESPTIWTKRYIALTYNRIGNLAKERKADNWFMVSLSHYSKGYSIFKEIYYEIKDTDLEKQQVVFLKDLAIAAARLGDIEIKKTEPDFDKVKKHYDESFALCQRLCKLKETSLVYNRELANSLRRLGDVSIFIDAVAAYNYYLDSLKILQKIVSDWAIKDSPSSLTPSISKIIESNQKYSAEKSEYIILPYERRETDLIREHILCFMRLTDAAIFAKQYEQARIWCVHAKKFGQKLVNSRFTDEAKSDLDIIIKQEQTIKQKNNMKMLQEAQELVIEIVNTAYVDSQKIYTEYSVKGKELRDIVSDVDVYMENRIIEVLKSKYPFHFYSAEERGEALIKNPNEDFYEWVIDPIDGTINFVAGLPFFTTSVCLKHCNELVLGVIIHHAYGDVYSAIKGGGAFKNGNPIYVSKTAEAKDSILSFMLTSHYDEAQTDWILGIVRNLSLKTRGLRLLVSQAYELALIASGQMDGTVCIKSRGFSSSAGSLLVQEAGGVVSDLYGKERTKQSTSLLVSNGLLHEELVELMNAK